MLHTTAAKISHLRRCLRAIPTILGIGACNRLRTEIATNFCIAGRAKSRVSSLQSRTEGAQFLEQPIEVPAYRNASRTTSSSERIELKPTRQTTHVRPGSVRLSVLFLSRSYVRSMVTKQQQLSISCCLTQTIPLRPSTEPRPEVQVSSSTAH